MGIRHNQRSEDSFKEEFSFLNRQYFPGGLSAFFFLVHEPAKLGGGCKKKRKKKMRGNTRRGVEGRKPEQG